MTVYVNNILSDSVTQFHDINTSTGISSISYAVLQM